MGTDKALLEIDGRPMAARVADALRTAGAVGVTALGGDGGGLRSVGLDHVEDRWPGEGPLGAVVHALTAIGASPHIAVLACDLLHPDPVAIRALLGHALATDADVTVPVVDGRPQWTHALWHRRVGRLLGDVFDSGERSLVGAVTGLRTEFVPGIDRACADADTPGDLP